MPKDMNSPSMNFDVNEYIKQSKKINQENNKSLDDYKKKTEAYKSIDETLNSYEAEGVDTSKYRKKLDKKADDMDMGFSESLHNSFYTNMKKYQNSFVKFDNLVKGKESKPYETLSDQMKLAKDDREGAINPISNIAKEVVTDPLTYLPLGLTTKGGKVVKAAKDFGKGAAVTSGAYTAKEYGDDDFKAGDALLAGAFGGSINAGIGRLVNRKITGDLVNPDVTSGENITNKILFEQKKLNPDIVAAPTQPTADEVIQENIIKSDDDVASKINAANFGETSKPTLTEAEINLKNEQLNSKQVNDFFNPVDANRVQVQGNGKLPTPASQQDPFVYDPKQTQDTLGFSKDAQRNSDLEQLKSKIEPLNKILEQNQHKANMFKEKADTNPYIFEKPQTIQSKLPDTLPTNPDEFKEVMQYAIKNDAVDEFISKLPKGARIDKVQEFFNNLKPAQPKQDNLFLKNDLVEPRKTDSGIYYSSGSQTFGGGAIGGLESEFNQRDYNNDGKHDYKDNLIGLIIGAVGVNAAKKIMPKAFKDTNIDKNTTGMFVGARPDEAGAFSDVATRKTMREIDDRGAKFDKKNIDILLSNLNGKVERKIEKNYYDFEQGLKTADEYQEVENKLLNQLITSKTGTFNLDRVFKHDELFNKYPELKDVQVEFSESVKKGNAQYNSNQNKILISRYEPDADIKNKLLHEIQHAIQSKEGWARGGSTNNVVPRKVELEISKLETLLSEVKKEQKEALTFDDIRKLKREGNKSLLEEKRLKAKELSNIADEYEKKLNKLKDENNPFDSYQRLHGEQQARATQQRMNYTPEQRVSEDWTKTLEKTEGKYNEPIIKYDGGVAESVDKNTFKNIEHENKSTLPKIPTSKIFKNTDDYYGVPTELRNQKEKIIGTEAEKNLKTKTVKIEDIVPTQKNLNIDNLKKVNTISDAEDGIIAIEHNGKYYLNDGHHRVANEILKGNKEVSIQVMSSPTLSGGMVGGVVGGTNDLDGDGKITYKDILIGVGAGAGGTKIALAMKNTNIANKAKGIIKAIGDTETADKILGHKIYQKKDYMALREATIKNKNVDAEKFAMLHEQLKLLDDTTRTKMYNYMNGDRSIQLGPNIKQLADNYTNEINKMGQELVDLGVLEKAQFDKFKDRYLHRRYEKDLTQKFNALFTKGKTVQGVHTRGNEWTGTKTEFDALTKNGEIGDFFDGKIEATRMGNGQYKFRQDWTEEQRTKWGEVKDIAFSLPETLMRTKEMVEHAKMLKNIVDKTGYVSNEALEGYTQLQGKRFGALNGKYVPTDMKLDITEFGNALFGEEGKLLSSKAMEAFKMLSTFWKKSHTVYNPIAHLNNLTSNVTMQFGAGVNPHRAVANATKGAMAAQKVNQFRELTAKKIIGLSQEEEATLRALGQDEDLKLWNQAQEAGLFGRSNLNDILNKYVNPTATPTKAKGLRKAANKVDDFASNMYQGEDNIMRFSMMKSLMQDNKTFEEAFKIVNETIPDYTKPMSQWARFGRDSMLTPFISWTYYATPIVLKQMRDRPGRILGIYAALYGINKMWGIDPFDERDIPQQNFSMKRIPIYKNGNEVTTIKVDRWIPHGDILSPLDFAKNLTSGGAWAGGQDVLRNRNSYFGGKITNNEGGLKAYDLTKYAVQQITPDILDNFYNLGESKIMDKKNRTKNPVIQPRTTTQELLKVLGINVMTYNKSNQRKKAINEKLK